MKRISMFLVVLFAFSVTAAWAQSKTPSGPTTRPLVLYDDFNGPRIDPAKWLGASMNDGVLREVVRELAPADQDQGGNRALHLFLRQYSWTGNDVGLGFAMLGLQFANPASVTETSLAVVVKRAEVTGCQSNASPGHVEADFIGHFFNTEANPTSDVGDVELVIDIHRDATRTGSALSVDEYYTRIDDELGNRTTLDWKNLGWIYPGQLARLRMKWDQPNHQFIFQLNKDPEVISAYSVPDMSPPNSPGKGIYIVPGVPSCTTTPLGSAMMDAYFDNVYVNAH
jgi:hypothetical protein